MGKKESFWKGIEKEFLFFDKARKKLNIAYNIEKLFSERKKGVAIYWQGVNARAEITYEELFSKSNQFANLLKTLGIKKGDKCFIFLPRVPELYIAFLGILKTGAIATILFPAFGKEGLKERMEKGDCKLIITNAELKERIYAIDKLPKSLKFVVVVGGEARREGGQKKEVGKGKKAKNKVKEISFGEIEKQSKEFRIVETSKDDAALMVFTSATAGTPVAGILLRHYAFIQQVKTAEWVLDLKENDVYWCTADPGWVTGVVYGIIAPLALGIKLVSYEGRFDAEAWYKIIQDYKVSVIYTAPTALRMLMQSEAHKKYNLKSLRHICSVGEYLNPEILEKVKQELGITVHDTYWQSETGAIIIANMPGMQIKPGSMGKPVPGINAFVVDENGKRLKENQIGFIALTKDFPSLMKGIYKKRAMYKKYFIKDLYITGDLAYVDKDGYFFFAGRRDDMIKTSGERVSVLEIESHLLKHPGVAECAVVGKPDPIRGEIVVAFIVLSQSYKQKVANAKTKQELAEEIKKFMKTELAGHAYPREVYFVNQLPKTRSGKISRRICKAILLGQQLEEKDTSALANPEAIDEIRREVKETQEAQTMQEH
jgi:acetyl-CoA synthetase